MAKLPLFAGVFTGRTVLMSVFLLLIFTVMQQAPKTTNCSKIGRSIADNFVDGICNKEGAFKGTWDTTLISYIDMVPSLYFIVALSAVVVITIVYIGRVPRTDGFFLALLEVIFGVFAVGIVFCTLVSLVRTVPKINESVCQDMVGEAVHILFNKKSCKNPVYAITSQLPWDELTEEITEHNLYIKYMKTPINSISPIIKQLYENYQIKHYLPYLLIGFGLLVLFKPTQKMTHVLALVLVLAFAAALSTHNMINHLPITSATVLNALSIFGVISLCGLLGLLAVLVISSTISIWPLMSGCAVIAMKFSTILSAPWYATFALFCFLSRWLFCEVTDIFILGGSYLVWQGIAILHPTQIQSEWMFIVFGLATIYHNILDMRWAMEMRQKRYRVPIEKKEN